jgi:hypothetical protein
MDHRLRGFELVLSKFHCFASLTFAPPEKKSGTLICESGIPDLHTGPTRAAGMAMVRDRRHHQAPGHSHDMSTCEGAASELQAVPPPSPPGRGPREESCSPICALIVCVLGLHAGVPARHFLFVCSRPNACAFLAHYPPCTGAPYKRERGGVQAGRRGEEEAEGVCTRTYVGGWVSTLTLTPNQEPSSSSRPNPITPYRNLKPVAMCAFPPQFRVQSFFFRARHTPTREHGPQPSPTARTSHPTLPYPEFQSNSSRIPVATRGCALSCGVPRATPPGQVVRWRGWR